MSKIKAELIAALESVVSDENELSAWLLYVNFIAGRDELLYLYCDYRTNGETANVEPVAVQQALF